MAMEGSCYKNIFKPLKIGSVTLPNRIFFPPWCFNWANTDGTLSDKLYDFYTDIADGGCGLIIMGCAAVSPDSLLYERSMKIYNKNHIVRLKDLSKYLHSRGTVPGIQLMNFGRQSITTYTNLPVYGPSAIPCPVKSKKDPNYSIREMTIEDIQRVKNDFVNAAILAVEAGIKLIQVHAAHGFLLNQFLSPYSNLRQDEYGGTTENRARFIVEIIREIREKTGTSAAIDIRISADEFVDGGLTANDYEEIIPLLEKAGVDMINVSFSVSETSGILFNQRKNPQGRYAYLAKQIKNYTTKPVGYAGFIADLTNGSEIMEKNNIDLIGIGRAQVADPFLVQKHLLKNEPAIRKCGYDNHCLFSFSNENEKQVYCKVNPKYKKIS